MAEVDLAKAREMENNVLNSLGCKSTQLASLEVALGALKIKHTVILGRLDVALSTSVGRITICQ